MKYPLAALAAVATLAAVPMSQTPAQARGLEVGWLDCVVDKAGRLEILTSDRNLRCTFNPWPRSAYSPQSYSGTIEKWGLNIGATGYKLVQWKVWQVGEGAGEAASLSGTYYGASAEATAAIGVGANVLGGGSNSSFLLQPVSVQEQAGANAAVHITRLTLEAN